MPSRPEGGVSLLVNNTAALALSTIAMAATLTGGAPQESNQQAQLTHAAESQPAKPQQALELGKLVTQYNYYEWYDLKPVVTTTTTTQPETDATSTNTPDWRCIKQAEGSNANGNYTQLSGAFGFLIKNTWQGYLPQHGFTEGYPKYSVPNDAPPAIQDEAALFLYAHDNYHFYPSWDDYCTQNGIVR